MRFKFMNAVFSPPSSIGAVILYEIGFNEIDLCRSKEHTSEKMSAEW